LRLVHVFDGVAEQVLEHLLNAGFFRLDRRQVARNDNGDMLRRRERIDHFPQQLIQIDRGQGFPDTPDARVLQNAVDQPVHAPHALGDQAQIFAAFVIQLRCLVRDQPVGQRADAAQRRFQVMRDDISEIFQLFVGALHLSD